MILLQLLACMSDYGLQSLNPAGERGGAGLVAEAPTAPPVRRIRPARPPVWRPVPVGSGTAVTAVQSDRGDRQETFEVGADRETSRADWVFVLDPSSSMDTVIARVQAAFAGLAHEGVFPSDSRVAVLSTTPAARPGSARLHRSVRATPGGDLEPGFGHLVSRERIAAFRAATTPDLAARFSADGCGAWFTPTEQDAAGVPCFVANTQISGAVVRAEAGLTALSQWLQATREPFRPGAAVNVVFVSDTHDPGTDSPKSDDLVTDRPTAAGLRALAERDEPLASFRLHAIAPASECGEPWPDGPSYAEASADSGGWTLDLCTATDYRPLIRSIADDGVKPEQAVLSLGEEAGTVRSVRVDGQPVGFSASPSGRSVVLDRLPAHGVRVEVEYRPKPAGVRAR